MRYGLTVVAVLVGIFLGIGFALGNTAPVDVRFYVISIEQVPLWQALVSAIALGFLVAGVGLGWPLVRSSVLVRQQRRRISRLEQEIHGLRTLPLGTEGEEPARHAEEG
jgi:uncharacterized membrane protein YciS (DUF1049 family)